MSRTVLFAVNISESPATAKMILHPEEYGVSCAEQLEISLEPLSVSVIELDAGEEKEVTFLLGYDELGFFDER
jgi:hypothetical protein